MRRGGRLPRTPNTGNWRADNTCGACALARDASFAPVRARSSAAWRAHATCSKPLFGKGLDVSLDVRQELIGDGAVDDAVVEGNREVGARTDRDRVLPIRPSDHLGSLLDRADAENRD